MALIRHIEVRNFRSISHIEWWTKPGLNCLIGPGDSGKSTLLDAIDLALGARRSYPFTDADFHLMDTSKPIEIILTLGNLDDGLKDLESYGYFFRGINSDTRNINDEKQAGDETALTIRLTVREDLEPEWLLYSERAVNEGIEKRLLWKHRELVSPTRLGMTSQHHLAWGNRSILNKLSEEQFDVTSTLAQISRQARGDFAEHPQPQLANVLGQVRTIANELGVPVGELKALLDVNGVSLTNGAISLHNTDDTPLRQLGTGSSRLLISGLHKAASNSQIILVDEAEYGLEPYRISRLLHELGSKEQHPVRQVFITTHSPYVLRELQAQQLHVLRKFPSAPLIEPATATQIPVVQPPVPQPPSHAIYSLNGGNDEQATLRACAEAFFSKAVIVGEGATEVGLLRGFDLHLQRNEDPGLLSRGISVTDGNGGDTMFKRAEIFKNLGYPTALLKDSDITEASHLQRTTACRQRGVNVIEWEHGLSTEGAIFYWCSVHLIPSLIHLSVALNGEQEVDQHIRNCSQNNNTLQLSTTAPNDSMRQALASAASKYKWFKHISNAEMLAIDVVFPNYTTFLEPFTKAVNNLYNWVRLNGDQR
ncbi:ATP-dependent nuclease [Shewanella fodinae]|uniref:Putative ATP-dependent endonuclease of OLD family n=1 Tax=Shewanella fodinae TaxID=552357 RepID=A0A4R2FAB0_9GAMM|nr:ATP-binding protein [Shewanella fodinae]TCN84230.1 putative ATP-dependent endonuclease of OLD family [Shewanella fodinae]